MFSKAEEYLEHCVHVCKAAVIDLAEPLLTVLLDDGLRLGWRCFTFLVLVEYSLVIWSVDRQCIHVLWNSPNHSYSPAEVSHFVCFQW